MQQRFGERGLPSDSVERAEQLRAAVEQNHSHLCRGIGALVFKSRGSMSTNEAKDLVQEILNETVQEALRCADRYDPARSASAWLMGIAVRILANRQRQSVRQRRQARASDLGNETWEAILDKLCSVPPSETGLLSLDLHAALNQLDTEARLAIESRYFQGLDGEALARALGAPSSGAARVRVCRALQALRALLARPEEEVTS